MSTITSIREAQLSDVDSVAGIHVSCWREVYCFMPERVLTFRDEAYRINQWRTWMKERPVGQALYVLEADIGVVGFAVAKPNTDDAIDVPGEFHACYILPAFRGGVAGPLAMITLAVFLKDQGLWPACVWAFRSNPYRRIYPALGCKPEVFRERLIEGVSLPEIGYRVSNYENLIRRLNLMLRHAKAKTRK